MFRLVFAKILVKAINTICNDFMHWHQRYGHLNVIGLTLLPKKKLVRGLPLIKAKKQLCEACICEK